MTDDYILQFSAAKGKPEPPPTTVTCPRCQGNPAGCPECRDAGTVVVRTVGRELANYLACSTDEIDFVLRLRDQVMARRSRAHNLRIARKFVEADLVAVEASTIAVVEAAVAAMLAMQAARRVDRGRYFVRLWRWTRSLLPTGGQTGRGAA